MQSSLDEKTHWQPAPCRAARRLLVIVIIASVVVVLAAAADLLLRAPLRDDPASAWMRALTLSAPTLWPAGSPMRHPETVHPGVDLRFSPALVTAP